MTIQEAKHIHLVGIKGVAMTSLAQCLLDMGKTVTGSDVDEDFVTQDLLSRLPIQIESGFSHQHVSPEVDMVVYTGAHQGKNNPEVQYSITQGMKALSQAEALGVLMDTKKGMSVCGTGGKSTTSAMIAYVMERLGKNPSYSVGVGNIPSLGRTGKYREDSEWFIAEADEYAVDPTVDRRPRFVYQHPKIIVCTNLTYDHPDIYGSFEDMKRVFIEFFNTLPQGGSLIVNGDSPEITSLLPQVRHDIEIIRVGSSAENEVSITDLVQHERRLQASIRWNYTGQSLGTPQQTRVSLQVPGEHNLRNAVYAWVTTGLAQCNLDEVMQSLGQFTGTTRRFEYKGTLNGARCYDDYAHTPEEIHTTIAALRAWEPGKNLVVAFQPHTFSRTRALFDGFVQALSEADEIVLTDIFASARETEDLGMTSDLLATAIQEQFPSKNIINVHTVEELAAAIPSRLQETDVCITLGAGDIYQVYQKLPIQVEP